MASIETPREQMAALMAGRSPRRRSKNVIRGRLTHEEAGEVPALFSYGPHFPMAFKVGDGWAVNLGKYSVTTSTHQRGVRAALEAAGLRPTGRLIDHGQMTFEVWQ